MSEIINCPHCNKLIDPVYEDGDTTVPDINGNDMIVDMGSWYECPRCGETLDDYEPEDLEFNPEHDEL